MPHSPRRYRGGAHGPGELADPLDDVPVVTWHHAVCDRCGWTAHTTKPPERCPNDGRTVVVLGDRVYDSTAATVISRLARTLRNVGELATDA